MALDRRTTVLAVLLALTSIALGQQSYPACTGSGGGICTQVLTVFCNKLTCGSCCQHVSTCNPDPNIYTLQSTCVVSDCSQVQCPAGQKCALIGPYGTCVADCSQPTTCTPAPCQTASCPRKPAATCYNNNCGGCNAEFYLKGLRITNCAVSTTTSSSSGTVATRPTTSPAPSFPPASSSGTVATRPTTSPASSVHPATETISQGTSTQATTTWMGTTEDVTTGNATNSTQGDMPSAGEPVANGGNVSFLIGLVAGVILLTL